MNRRVFLCGTTLLVLAPSLAAGHPRPPLVGVLTPGVSTSPITRANNDAFELALRELGWRAGENIRLDYRYGDGDAARVAHMASDVVDLGVDVIVARSSAVAQAARRATASIPIVMAGSGLDPVRLGLVTSLAAPGGNVTGLMLLARQLSAKQLELLKEVLPRLGRVAVVSSTVNPATSAELAELDAAARVLGVAPVPIPVAGPDDLDAAFERVRREGAEAIVVLSDPFVLEPYRQRIVALASRHRLPAIYWLRSYVDAGGLMSYGTDLTEVHRRAALYVDRILRGARPSELPVEQPTKFELVINLKTARTLGLTIPPALRLRADHVID